MDKKTLDASVTDAMKSSQEAQEMATVALQRLSSQYGMDNMSGTDAAKVLQQYDDRHKEAMKLIRKNYGDDIRGFDKFMLAYGAKMEDERRSIAKMCGAEMRHGLGVAVKTDTENRFADIEHRDMLDGASVTAGQAVANEEASEAFHSRLDEIDSEAEEAKVRARQDYESAIAQEGADKERLETEYKAKIAAIDSATSISRGATAGESVDALKKIKGMESSNAASKAKPLRDDFRNIFIQRLKAEGSDCLGHSPEIAMANALQATRNGVIGYFTNRIKSGQVAAVLATLDELEKLGDDDFEASKAKSPTGVYDPSAYGFLRKSDIEALRKSAKQMIEEANAEARSNEAISLANGNAVLKSLVYGAQTQIDALYDKGDAVTPEDAQVLNKSLQDIIGKIDEMYSGNPKLVGNHVKQIRSYYRSAQARYMKTMNLASNCQNEADFKELLQKYNNATSEVSEIDVPEIDENGQLTGKTIKASVDTHKAYVITLNQARRAGFCKGAEWNTGARAHLEPQKRAHRIQAALNDFLVEKQGGQTCKSPAGRIALDVNADGTVSVGNANKELGNTFFDDADKGWFDSDIKIPPAVIRDVVKALDGYCISSLVTPTDEQLREQLNLAFDTAQAKNDARMFGYNFLEAIRQRTAARFDPVLNREVYGDDRARYRYLERRGMPIDPSLRKSVENGKLQPSFQFLRNSIMPRSEQMKRRIAEQDNGRLDADDYIGDAEEQ